jgi:hypothetical protein
MELNWHKEKLIEYQQNNGVKEKCPIPWVRRAFDRFLPILPP